MNNQQAQQISKSQKYQAIKQAYTYEMFCAEMARDMSKESAKTGNSEYTADDIAKYQSTRKAYEALTIIASLA